MADAKPGRWEWRTFGDTFGSAEAAIAALPLEPPVESDELYLLGPGPDTVKVRYGLLDIKVLQAVDPAGLQQWIPVLKVGFPVAADDVRRALAGLGVEPASLARAAYDLDQLLDEVIAGAPEVRAVRVIKHRARTTINGCTAEVSEIEAEGRRTRTIAVESEDGLAVRAAVRSLGLADFVNTGYPPGLKALLDHEGPRYAVIDVGTNSVKAHVGELDSVGQWRAILDRAVVTRLGEGMSVDGQLAAPAVERTIDAITALIDEARALGALAVAVVGTAGLRAARNSDAVIGTIRDRTGHVLEVISGDEEGRLAYVATKAMLGLGDESVVVFDTGGGSSQFTFGHGVHVERRFSVPIGAVRITERFGLDRPVGPDVITAARAAIAEELVSIADGARPDAVVGMGGAVTNLTAMDLGLATYDPEAVRRHVLRAADIDARIEQLRGLDADARRSILGLQPARAEVILAGACIVRTVLHLLQHDALTVSDRGLRHGLLVEKFGPIPEGGTP